MSDRPGRVTKYDPLFLLSILEGFVEEPEYLEREFKGILLNNHFATYIFLLFKYSLRTVASM